MDTLLLVSCREHCKSTVAPMHRILDRAEAAMELRTYTSYGQKSHVQSAFHPGFI